MSTQFHRCQTLPSQHSSSSRVNRNIYPNYNVNQSSSQLDSSTTGVKSVNPFISSPHGHPSYAPVKLGSKGAADNKMNKQPKPPDKPLMPYMRYSRKVSRLVWDSVKANNPDLKLWEIGKIIGQMWRELGDDQKQEYIDEYESEKAQYMDAMKTYHNSPAYLSWVATKGKVDVDNDVDEPEKNTKRNKGPIQRELTDQKIVTTIQANEDEDDLEDCYSIKNVSAARYYRNHCLINEIFSEAIVPDGRAIINETRMVVLKRQVQSLTMHQKKLENELQQIEERHKSKKCKFTDSCEQFSENLTKLCESRPQITDEQFDVMVVKAKEEMIKQKILLEQQQAKQQQQLQHRQQMILQQQLEKQQETDSNKEDEKDEVSMDTSEPVAAAATEEKKDGEGTEKTRKQEETSKQVEGEANQKAKESTDEDEEKTKTDLKTSNTEEDDDEKTDDELNDEYNDGGKNDNSVNNEEEEEGDDDDDDDQNTTLGSNDGPPESN
ncbi:hypothetical protein HELRODRAFT_188630 [Helobdella robusta]|uniref:HMG box domain-containing protein n=1 Tax=Helobdella robusta TaxID=6412 RepID=T1FQ71_HELRO|nr:hypothetical protein HELRODRAFT_188630 [Helobdella robusta]ESO02224.1 hypothetical protein HELRODRAFT_188630 [Helobdella robusta]